MFFHPFVDFNFGVSEKCHCRSPTQCSIGNIWKIIYKEIILPHNYRADFVVFENIIVEIKATKDVIDSHFKQTINYLAASKILLV